MPKARPATTPADYDALYEQAVEYLHKGAYKRAGHILHALDAAQPGYRDAAALAKIADEGKRAQTFVQWSAALFMVVVVAIVWLVWRPSDLWVLIIGALALLVGIGLAQQVYARFFSPQLLAQK
jgi:ferric-dicitrate binding protein FerR (iron transport regulator)